METLTDHVCGNVSMMYGIGSLGEEVARDPANFATSIDGFSQHVDSGAATAPEMRVRNTDRCH